MLEFNKDGNTLKSHLRYAMELAYSMTAAALVLLQCTSLTPPLRGLVVAIPKRHAQKCTRSQKRGQPFPDANMLQGSAVKTFATLCLLHHTPKCFNVMNKTPKDLWTDP
ncbi:Phospholipid-Transporting Atpase Id [Manis pentadactyla]|nr:Phospholipid-Transporting Atpase Id [Manis pentadactyla]